MFAENKTNVCILIQTQVDYIHTHGVVSQALMRAGNTLIQLHPEWWSEEIEKIGSMDWRRANTVLRESRALLAGRVSESQQNVSLTTNAIKNHLGLPLSPEEQRAQDAFRREVDGAIACRLTSTASPRHDAE